MRSLEQTHALASRNRRRRRRRRRQRLICAAPSGRGGPQARPWPLKPPACFFPKPRTGHALPATALGHRSAGLQSMSSAMVSLPTVDIHILRALVISTSRARPVVGIDLSTLSMLTRARLNYLLFFFLSFHTFSILGKISLCCDNF